MKRRLLRAISPALLAAALAAVSGCGRGADPPPQSARAAPAGAMPGGRGFAPIPVQAVAVRVGPLTAESSTAGSVVPVLQSQVAARGAGIVARVMRNPGEWVKAGDPVVQLEDSQLVLAVRNAEAGLQSARINLAVGQDTTSQSNPRLQLEVQAARSALAAAQKNYDAQQALFRLGGASAAALDNADSQLQQAQADLKAAQSALEQNQKSGSQSLAQLKLAADQAANRLQAAQLDLRNAAVCAPFDGHLAAVNVSPGVFVSQNNPVFLLVSAARQVSFAVPPTEAVSLPAGSAVLFSYAGRRFPLRISQAPSAPINGVVPMVAAVPASFSLPFGAVGAVGYTLSVARGALLPVAALAVRENRTVVYDIVGGKATLQEVTVLGETEVTVAVAGVPEGATVILNPPPGLIPGAAVQAAGAAPLPGAERSPPAAAGLAGGRP